MHDTMPLTMHDTTPLAPHDFTHVILISAHRSNSLHRNHTGITFGVIHRKTPCMIY
jgi:hypothetical protein